MVFLRILACFSMMFLSFEPEFAPPGCVCGTVFAYPVAYPVLIQQLIRAYPLATHMLLLL